LCAVSQIWNFCVFFICHLVQTGFIKHFKLHNCDFSSNDHILTKANVYHFKSKVARWVFCFVLFRSESDFRYRPTRDIPAAASSSWRRTTPAAPSSEGSGQGPKGCESGPCGESSKLKKWGLGCVHMVLRG